MRSPLWCLVAILTLVGMVPFSVRAEYLSNTDFKEGSQAWHGDGQAAFLKPDGTEGSEGDPGAVAVIRILLSKSQPRAIYQDYTTPDHPRSQHIKVDVFASKDFKRSKFPNDYDSGINWKAGETWYWSEETTPTSISGSEATQAISISWPI